MHIVYHKHVHISVSTRAYIHSYAYCKPGILIKEQYFLWLDSFMIVPTHFSLCDHATNELSTFTS